VARAAARTRRLRNPAEAICRPPRPAESATASLARHRLTDWLTAVELRGGARWAAAMLLGLNGLRCGELVTGNVEDLGNHFWRHTLKLARDAAIPVRLTPHGLRHPAITIGLDAGVSLRDKQDFARRADPKATRRYDRPRHAWDRHATCVIAHYRGGGRWIARSYRGPAGIRGPRYGRPASGRRGWRYPVYCSVPRSIQLPAVIEIAVRTLPHARARGIADGAERGGAVTATVIACRRRRAVQVTHGPPAHGSVFGGGTLSCAGMSCCSEADPRTRTR
jgi:hypothetical protein